MPSEGIYMLQSPISPRQQAHDLLDRINSEHLAVAVCMLRTMADAEQAAPKLSAFSDELFSRREHTGTAEKVPCQGQAVDPMVVADLRLKTDDSDYWPERQHALMRHPAGGAQ